MSVESVPYWRAANLSPFVQPRAIYNDDYVNYHNRSLVNHGYEDHYEDALESNQMETFLKTAQVKSTMPSFHWASINDKTSDAVLSSEDDGVVLLVSLFNLFAIVVYAAHKQLSDENGLSSRVIQWQIQKVLDELVLKVHSSEYASNLLSRALKVGSSEGYERSLRSNSSFLASQFEYLLKMKFNTSVSGYENLKNLIETIKFSIIKEISASIDSKNLVAIDPDIYEPLVGLYSTLVSEEDNKIGTGRALSLSKLEKFIDSIAAVNQLNVDQIKGVLETLTRFGQANEHLNVLPLLDGIIKHPNLLENVDGKQRNLLVLQNIEKSRSRKRELQSTRRDYNSRYPRTFAAEYKIDPKTLPKEFRKRLEEVELKDDFNTNNHWSDKWFTLVTKAAPVGLDMTTLYAKARARPVCLRALLCRANQIWKKVGPLQMALSPFLSVLVSWSLETSSPHSLGDSLIAVRAGWMGKNCNNLYPECPLKVGPHPATKEAVTFFSRLEMAANPSSSYHVSNDGDFLSSVVEYKPLFLKSLYSKDDTHPPNNSPFYDDQETEYSSYHSAYTQQPGMSHYYSANKITQRPLYEKYESPDGSALLEGSISSSNSVSGMNLQDKLTRDQMQAAWDNFYHQKLPHEKGDRNGGYKYMEKANREDRHSNYPHSSNSHSSPLKKRISPDESYSKPVDISPQGPRNSIKHAYFRRHKKPNRGMVNKKTEKEKPHQPIPTPPRQKEEQQWYKYGLRRGLPARSVKGFSNSTNKQFFTNSKTWSFYNPHAKLKHKPKLKYFKTSSTSTTLAPQSTTKALEKKGSAQFGPKDAVTDAFRNELLYEYIRDRHITDSVEDARAT